MRDFFQSFSLPVPVSITLLWVLAEVVKGLGAGVILSLTYDESLLRPREAGAESL